MLAALLLAAPLFAPSAAPPTAPPQGRLLRQLGKLADDLPTPRGARRRARRYLDGTPDGASGDVAVLASDGSEIRAYTRGGPEEGSAFESLADAAGAVHDVTGFIVDTAGLTDDDLTGLVGLDVPLSILDAEGHAREVRSMPIDGVETLAVLLDSRLFAPLVPIEGYRMICDQLDERVNGEDVALFVENSLHLDGSGLLADGRFTGGDELQAAIADAGETPLVVCFDSELGIGPVLDDVAPERGGLWLALDPGAGPTAADLGRALEAEDVGTLLGWLVPGDERHAVDVVKGPGGTYALRSRRLAEDGTARPFAIGTGLSRHGLASPPGWAFFLFATLVLGLLLGREIGDVLAWPLRKQPEALGWLKRTALGTVPFLPFGFYGAVGIFVAGVCIPFARGAGWLVTRPTRFRPESWADAKLTAIGAGALGLLALVTVF